MRVVVPDALAGERVDRAVAFLTDLPRTTVAAMVGAGQVSVNGKAVVTRSRRVTAGDVLEVDVVAPAGDALAPDASIDIAVTYEDADVLVVDKPAGLVVHPGAGTRTGTLVHALLARCPDLAGQAWPDPSRPGIVHRLDKGTSGLLMVARNPDAAAALTAQLQARTVDRRYVALVAGVVEADAGTIDAPVGRSSRDRTRMAVSAGGRDARTNYRVIERLTDGPRPWTVVECKLDTGRTHQIRVHLSAIGHPVAGDVRYRGAQVPGLSRPFLHARALAFDHPKTRERLAFESPLPADLEAVRKAVRAAP